MNVYLVQHAEAKPENEDPERPLTDQGWEDIKKVAAFVREHLDVRADRIVHSGKLRARQTAEVLAPALNLPDKVNEEKNLKPNDDVSPWVDRLNQSEKDIVLVGHLPFMNKISDRLLGQEEGRNLVQFQMGGILCLARSPDDPWSVHWMVVPQIL